MFFSGTALQSAISADELFGTEPSIHQRNYVFVLRGRLLREEMRGRVACGSCIAIRCCEVTINSN